jgi:hypothetical protein
MLGRRNYTQEELDSGKTAIAQQLEAYRRLEAAVHEPPWTRSHRSSSTI